MSKRKRIVSNEIEDELQFDMSKLPSDREGICDSVITEINLCKTVINRSKLKLQKLCELADDFRTVEALDYMDKANKKCSYALTSVEKSRLKWTSFNCLPDIPIRNILSYLNVQDKRNFRLSSKTNKDIIDTYASEFKYWIVDLDIKEKRSFKTKEFIDSDKPIIFKSLYEFQNDEDYLLRKFFDRIAEMEVDVSVLNHIALSTTEDLDKVEKLSVQNRCRNQIHEVVSLCNLPVSVFKTLTNLKHLALYDVSVCNLKNGRFTLPCLKVIDLENVTSHSGLPNLLSSCHSDLEELHLANFSDLDFTAILEPGCVMNKLKIFSMRDMRVINGIFEVIANGFRNVQDLDLKNVGSLRDVDDRRYELPNLKSLCLSCSNPVLLTILRCSTPNLAQIKLDDVMAAHLEAIEFDIEASVTSLSLFYFGETAEESERGLIRLLDKAAPSVKNLYLKGITGSFDDKVPEFPNLEKLTFKHGNISVLTDIAVNAPRLNDLLMDDMKALSDITRHELHGSVEKLCLPLSVISAIGEDFDDLKHNLALFSSSLKHLHISSAAFPQFEPLEIRLNVLAKITLDTVDILGGFENLLQVCRHTLEELEILGTSTIHFYSHIFSDKGRRMSRLKKLTVEFRLKMHREPNDFDIVRLGSKGFSSFLPHCPALKLLSLGLPDPFDVTELLVPDLELPPTLTTLQLYPKPTAKDLKMITNVVGDRDLTYWFFAPKKPARDRKGRSLVQYITV